MIFKRNSTVCAGILVWRMINSKANYLAEINSDQFY